MGNVGDSYANAVVESVIDLHKTDVIRRIGPSRNGGHVEFETLDWIEWLNTRWLLEPIGYGLSDECERIHYRNQEHMDMAPEINQ